MNVNPRDTWRLLKPHARPRVPVFLAIVLLGALAALGHSSVVLLLEPTWNLVLFPGQAEGAMEDGAGKVQVAFEWMRDQIMAQGWLAAASDIDVRFVTLLVVVGYLLFLAFVIALAQYSFNCLSGWASIRMVVDLRTRIVEHLMSLSLHYHSQRKLGDVISRVNADVGLTLNAVNVFFGGLVQNVLYFIFYLGVSAYAAPKMTLVVLLGMPLLVVPVSVLAKKVRKRSMRSLTTLGASVQILSQMFQGIRTVKIFRAEKKELERYKDLNERYVHDTMRMVRTVSLTQAWTILFSHVGLALVMLGVGWASIRMGLFDNGGTMTIFFLAQAKIYSLIKNLARALTQIEASVGASGRVLTLLEEIPEVTERADPLRVTSLGSGIKIENVSYTYPEGDLPAIRNLSLEMKPEQTLAIVGPSGSGKSTLMGLICRFFDPVEGRILIDGHDLRDLSLDSWTRLVSLVDQSPFLFHNTIADNIRYGHPEATQEETEEAARAAQIHDFIQSLPEGYDTNVADAGTRLSGGQLQRITIARALLKNPPLLLLDEATSSLDTESEIAVHRAMEVLMKGRTVIVIAHRLSTIRNAHRTAVLENGRLVELGTHEELLERGGAYARVLKMQQLAVGTVKPPSPPAESPLS